MAVQHTGGELVGERQRLLIRHGEDWRAAEDDCDGGTRFENGRHAITRGNFRVLRGAPTTKMAHQMLSLGLGNLEAYISGEPRETGHSKTSRIIWEK